jgi:hypothetical protein
MLMNFSIWCSKRVKELSKIFYFMIFLLPYKNIYKKKNLQFRLVSSEIIKHVPLASLNLFAFHSYHTHFPIFVSWLLLYPFLRIVIFCFNTKWSLQYNLMSYKSLTITVLAIFEYLVCSFLCKFFLLEIYLWRF